MSDSALLRLPSEEATTQAEHLTSHGDASVKPLFCKSEQRADRCAARLARDSWPVGGEACEVQCADPEESIWGEVYFRDAGLRVLEAPLSSREGDGVGARRSAYEMYEPVGWKIPLSTHLDRTSTMPTSFIPTFSMT